MHNRLYLDMTLDATIMDTYPDNGLLPGIEDCIFEDNTLSSTVIFEEETAGFTEHPAQMMTKNDDKSEGPLLFMEKWGFLMLMALKLVARHQWHQL